MGGVASHRRRPWLFRYEATSLLFLLLSAFHFCDVSLCSMSPFNETFSSDLVTGLDHHCYVRGRSFQPPLTPFSCFLDETETINRVQPSISATDSYSRVRIASSSPKCFAMKPLVLDLSLVEASHSLSDMFTSPNPDSLCRRTLSFHLWTYSCLCATYVSVKATTRSYSTMSHHIFTSFVQSTDLHGRGTRLTKDAVCLAPARLAATSTVKETLVAELGLMSLGHKPKIDYVFLDKAQLESSLIRSHICILA